jgi:hypothetical protein
VNPAALSFLEKAREKRFQSRPSNLEERLLKNAISVWCDLPEKHKEMVQDAVKEMYGDGSRNAVSFDLIHQITGTCVQVGLHLPCLILLLTNIIQVLILFKVGKSSRVLEIV